MNSAPGQSLYTKRRATAFEIAINVILWCVLAVAVLTLFFDIKYTGVYVINSSMLPTVVGAPDENSPGGDYVYMDNFAKPDYGDIIVLKPGDERNYLIIKRAFAFGGDRIYIKNGKVHVKRKGETTYKVVDEPYVEDGYSENWRYNPEVGDDLQDGYLVSEGGVFVLGDNRDISRDSRIDEAYSLSDVKGVVPSWSLSVKNLTTKINNFLNF